MISYRSFRCPKILSDGMDELITEWPIENGAWKLNRSKICFLAATYACQNGKLTEKKVIGNLKAPMQMIRMTEVLEKEIEKIVKSSNFSKTDFYVLAINEFLKICFNLLHQLDEVFFAMNENKGRGLLSKSTIQKLFPNEREKILATCEESFQFNKDDTVCISSKCAVLRVLCDALFKEGELDPRKVYTS